MVMLEKIKNKKVGVGKVGDKIRRVNDLEVYKLAFDCAMKIFEITKNFLPEERYSLTDQIRRSSRQC